MLQYKKKKYFNFNIVRFFGGQSKLIFIEELFKFPKLCCSRLLKYFASTSIAENGEIFFFFFFPHANRKVLETFIHYVISLTAHTLLVEFPRYACNSHLLRLIEMLGRGGHRNYAILFDYVNYK